MRYGYFDENTKEYVITRPDTPAPWANYLGSPEYGAIISNNAGGYSFVKSGAKGRILRYVFNSFDQPGRYIYLRDNDSGEIWSDSWQPCGRSLRDFKSEVRHGTAYTEISSDYRDIKTKCFYYVPLNKTHEVWYVSVKNCSDRTRNLTATGYAEFTNDSDYEQDQVNLQYTLFITRTYFLKNRIKQVINENVTGDKVNGSGKASRFFGLCGAPVSSYCGDKESFLGSYHDYSDPEGVITGNLGNKLNYNSNSCGALSTVFSLKPGETAHFAFVVGMKDDSEAESIIGRYNIPEITCKDEINDLKKYWHSKLSAFEVKTPSLAFNAMVNTWNAYQCYMTFIWSRAASFTYCGLRNGYGYRDTVQDIQGIIHLEPELAREKIEFMLSAQVNNGGGLPLVKFNHNAGHEDTPDDESYVRETGHPAYRADDALWLFPTVYKYITETGNAAFLDKEIPFANNDAASVYGHLKRAIDFSMNHLGNHGMPAGLFADWNDCLRLGKDGESTFVAFQLYFAMNIMRKFADIKNDKIYGAYIDDVQKKLEDTIEKLCWNEDRFIRGFKDDGMVIGKRDDPEASMWLNPQSWSVISGFASEEQSAKAMDNVYKLLNTKYGAMLMAPPYKDHAFEGALMLLFNASTKENGGIFSQSQGWLILAEALLGHGNRAYEYYTECSPASMNEHAEIRKLEPYTHGQFTEGKDSPNFGRAHVHWLTGTASTVMVASVEGILGMRPEIDGIRIAPSIPDDWDHFEIRKRFRGKTLNIKFENPEGKQSGYSSVLLNGKELDDNFIPESLMEDTNDIIYRF